MQGIFVWKSTGTKSSVHVKCPYESRLTATRKCVGDFGSGATWYEPSITNCPFKKLTSTEALDRLTKVKLYYLWLQENVWEIMNAMLLSGDFSNFPYISSTQYGFMAYFFEAY